MMFNAQNCWTMLNISNYQTTFQYLSETNHQIAFMSRGFAEILRVLEVCCTCTPCHTARSEIVRTEVVVPGFHPRVSKTTDQVKQKGSIEGIVLPSRTMDGTMDGPLAKPKMSETEDTGSVVWVSHCMIRFADDWHLASMFNMFSCSRNHIQPQNPNWMWAAKAVHPTSQPPIFTSCTMAPEFLSEFCVHLPSSKVFIGTADFCEPDMGFASCWLLLLIDVIDFALQTLPEPQDSWK